MFFPGDPEKGRLVFCLNIAPLSWLRIFQDLRCIKTTTTTTTTTYCYFYTLCLSMVNTCQNDLLMREWIEIEKFGSFLVERITSFCGLCETTITSARSHDGRFFLPKEVIHQEQLSEITEFLEARRHELQLDDIDFSKIRQPAVPNEPWQAWKLNGGKFKPCVSVCFCFKSSHL